MYLDAIAFRRKRDIVCDLDFRDNETVFLSELAAHLVDAVRQLLLRCNQAGGKLLAEAKLDLVGFERRLDGIALLLFRFTLLLAGLVGFRLALARLSTGYGNTDEGHCAAEHEERKAGRPA